MSQSQLGQVRLALTQLGLVLLKRESDSEMSCHIPTHHANMGENITLIPGHLASYLVNKDSYKMNMGIHKCINI